MISESTHFTVLFMDTFLESNRQLFEPNHQKHFTIVEPIASFSQTINVLPYIGIFPLATRLARRRRLKSKPLVKCRWPIQQTLKLSSWLNWTQKLSTLRFFSTHCGSVINHIISDDEANVLRFGSQYPKFGRRTKDFPFGAKFPNSVKVIVSLIHIQSNKPV